MSISRTTQQKKLGWLFETKEDETYKRFNFMDRDNSDLLFRIPEHQRFPCWNKDKKQKLVDSVLNNYPIHSIICSKHYDICDTKVKEYYDIEDGQTRLSILQSYFNGDFTNEHGYYFGDLSRSSQRILENYEVSIKEFFEMRGFDVNNETDLFESGAIDSMGIIELIVYIEEKLHIKVDVSLLLAENFRSLASIYELLEDA